MSLSKLNRLSIKLPAFVAAVIAAVALCLATLTYFGGREAAQQEAQLKLNLLIESRADGLQAWFDQIARLTQTVASSPSAAAAMIDFSSIWSALPETAREDIRQDYTTRSPYAAGERQNLDRADGEHPYHEIHARYHEFMRNVNEINHFYDVLLVDTDGNIAYSVFKESDFGQNVISGALADSGIGRVFQQAVDQAGDTTRFSSFDTYAPSNGAVAAFASARIYDASGQFIGVLIVQINVGEFETILNDPNGLGETAETFIVDRAGHMVIGSRFEDSARAFEQIPVTDHIAAALRGETAYLDAAVGLSDPSVMTISQPVVLGDTSYALVAEEAQSEIFAHLREQRNWIVIVSILLIAVMGTLAWAYIRTVTASLKNLSHEMGLISDGDFGLTVSATKRPDEIGDIGRTLVDFQSKLEIAAEQERQREHAQIEQQEVLDTLRRSLLGLADGDLSKKIDQEFSVQYDSLRKDFNDTVQTLNRTISHVVEAAGSIQHGANEISQASDDLSNRTENQAATLEQTAAALDQLTASVKSAADGAKSVENIVTEAQAEAEESGKIVGDAIAAMNEIEKSSEHISQIIGVIDDIAFQTNLLALNAGVEAARAGEAGKGFAVVASEVRALAQRSSEAAKEIKALISGSEKQVEKGVELVGGAGTALGNIVQRVTHISELIRSISTGSAEQAIGLGEINIGVNQLDQVTQQNAAMVEQATAASHVLRTDATRLQELVDKFDTGKSTNVVSFDTGGDMRGKETPDVEFQAPSVVEFDPVPAAANKQHAGGGQMNVAVAQGDWIDF
ncbi:methyl-accepting chemotaxis protein [Yoonia sp. BS5-3]|uniref:Methyl-accepting chemotaxis protein n=1 Tax=Yoonia phaeophyticola TaxID=3137369 RepID=A0ABZ2V437_9RHOB